MNARTISASLGLLLALGGVSIEAQAQSAPNTPPPARLPSASPPVPAPVRASADSARTRAPVLVPPVVPPPPAPISARATPVQAQVSASAAPPADATMQCKDGTYLSGAPAADRCRDRGGLATILPQRIRTP